MVGGSGAGPLGSWGGGPGVAFGAKGLAFWGNGLVHSIHVPYLIVILFNGGWYVQVGDGVLRSPVWLCEDGFAKWASCLSYDPFSVPGGCAGDTKKPFAALPSNLLQRSTSGTCAVTRVLRRFCTGGAEPVTPGKQKYFQKFSNLHRFAPSNLEEKNRTKTQFWGFWKPRKLSCFTPGQPPPPRRGVRDQGSI